jgi:hemoglobin
MEKKPSLFERMGGEPAVTSLVRSFYDKVLADPELKPFFEHASMDRLYAMQYEFFAAALDGPVNYSGYSIAKAHFGRGIGKWQLSRFVDHLLETLKDRHLSEDDIAYLISRVNTYSDEVTGGTAVAG